jgi:hypothetical protein
MVWAAASIVAFASFTNTELVRDVVVLDSGVAVAATSGGVDLFDGRGRPLDTLHTEDGLPSHETYAVRRLGDQVVIATARGPGGDGGGRPAPPGGAGPPLARPAGGRFGGGDAGLPAAAGGLGGALAGRLHPRRPGRG